MIVERIQSTLGNLFDIIIREMKRVRSASTYLNCSLIFHISKWSKNCCFSIAIDSNITGKVWLRANNSLAFLLRVCVSIIESSKPVSTDIGGKSPLTNPDWIIKSIGNFCNVSLVVITSSINICEIFFIIRFDECLVVMDIDCDSVVTLVKKTIPYLWVEIELSVMEYEPSIVCVFSYKFSRFLVPFF